MRTAMLMLTAVHHRVIFVVDQLENQMRLAYDLFHGLRRINGIPISTQLHGKISHLRILRNSSVDLDFDAAGKNEQVSLSDSRNRTHCIIDLRNKFICDNLADEAYFFDYGTYYNAPDAALPPDTTPLSFCLGDGIRECLSAHLNGRVQYCAERAKFLNGAAPLDYTEAVAVLKHRRELVTNFLSRTGILI